MKTAFKILYQKKSKQVYPPRGLKFTVLDIWEEMLVAPSSEREVTTPVFYALCVPSCFSHA